MTETPDKTLSCACGTVTLRVSGRPIIAAECHCNSCRTAGETLSALPLARPMREANGGTQYVCYRKDRVVFLTGQDRLKSYWLKPDAPTRRVVATCCNSPVFVEFRNGHWLSLYASLWPEAERPLPDIRTQTGDVPAGTALDGAVPSGGWQTAGFYMKLLTAWIGMGFRTPKVIVGDETAT